MLLSAKVTVLILQISNLKSKWPYFLGSLLVFSCSSSPKLTQEESDFKLDSELNSLSQSVKTKNENFGPNLKEKTPFIDKTEEYGLMGYKATSINAVDLNFDGHTDLTLMPNYYGRPTFLIYDPTMKKFREWDHDPLPVDFQASFILIQDINNDHVPDMISSVLNQKTEMQKYPVRFYLGQIVNKRLSFKLDTNFIKLDPKPTSSVSLVDYNLDGFLDIFIGNWFDRFGIDYIPSSDYLIQNNRGTSFEDVSSKLPGEHKRNEDQLYPPEARPTYGSSTCDIDQNGFPDILTVSSNGQKNKLWMNLEDPSSGERVFKDIGMESQYAADANGLLLPSGGGRSFFSACADYNQDQIMDIFLGTLTHAYDNDSVDRSSILTGSKLTYPPYFYRTEYLSDVNSESWNQGDRRGNWIDINNDGRIDLIVDNSGFPPHSRLVIFEQDETKAYVNKALEYGVDFVNPTGTIMIDINKDGKMDILSAQNNIRRADLYPRLYFFENNMPTEGRKSLRVYLDGTRSNSQGIGAMVMLYTIKGEEKLIQSRWMEFSQGGLPSQNEYGVHFGVDKNETILGLKIRWPTRKNKNDKNSRVLEKLYPLKDYLNGQHTEITACENGKLLRGKTSCFL